MNTKSVTFLSVVLVGAVLFQLGNVHNGLSKQRPHHTEASVVLPAAIQVILFGGERYLAGNVESFRAQHYFGSGYSSENKFGIQSHLVVSKLNPCHEDNYWIGNAQLSWGGASQAGIELLQAARECRFWDELPAFFYGFNQYFFNANITAALQSIESAAQRATDEHNAAAYRTFAIMLKAKETDSLQLALQLLQSEMEQTTDRRLRSNLKVRIGRLEGLATLRSAQKQFETRLNQKLKHPQELVTSGILKQLPVDPLGIGYDFHEQMFRLKQLRLH